MPSSIFLKPKENKFANKTLIKTKKLSDDVKTIIEITQRLTKNNLQIFKSFMHVNEYGKLYIKWVFPTHLPSERLLDKLAETLGLQGKGEMRVKYEEEYSLGQHKWVLRCEFSKIKSALSKQECEKQITLLANKLTKF